MSFSSRSPQRSSQRASRSAGGPRPWRLAAAPSSSREAPRTPERARGGWQLQQVESRLREEILAREETEDMVERLQLVAEQAVAALDVAREQADCAQAELAELATDRSAGDQRSYALQRRADACVKAAAAAEAREVDADESCAQLAALLSSAEEHAAAAEANNMFVVQEYEGRLQAAAAAAASAVLPSAAAEQELAELRRAALLAASRAEAAESRAADAKARGAAWERQRLGELELAGKDAAAEATRARAAQAAEAAEHQRDAALSASRVQRLDERVAALTSELRLAESGAQRSAAEWQDALSAEAARYQLLRDQGAQQRRAAGACSVQVSELRRALLRARQFASLAECEREEQERAALERDAALRKLASAHEAGKGLARELVAAQESLAASARGAEEVREELEELEREAGQLAACRSNLQRLAREHKKLADGAEAERAKSEVRFRRHEDSVAELEDLSERQARELQALRSEMAGKASRADELASHVLPLKAVVGECRREADALRASEERARRELAAVVDGHDRERLELDAERSRVEAQCAEQLAAAAERSERELAELRARLETAHAAGTDMARELVAVTTALDCEREACALGAQELRSFRELLVEKDEAIASLEATLSHGGAARADQQPPQPTPETRSGGSTTYTSSHRGPLAARIELLRARRSLLEQTFAM